MDYKVLDTKVSYICPIFHVEERFVKLKDNSKTTYYVIVEVPHVQTVALTKNNEIILIDIIRNGKKRLEIPGGKVNEFNPSIDVIKKYAISELLEETGYIAKNLEFLRKDEEKGLLKERDFYSYIAWDLEYTGRDDKSLENLNITVKLKSFKEINEILDKNLITEKEDAIDLRLALDKFRELKLI